MSFSESPDIHSLLADVVSVNHRLTRLASHAAGGTESPAVWRTLNALLDGPLRVGELAAVSRVSQPTMTKLINKLGERGWTERLVDPADARATVVGVTAAGEAARLEWRARLADALVPYFSGLSTEEAATLRGAVEILQTGIDRAALAPPVAAAIVPMDAVVPVEGVQA